MKKYFYLYKTTNLVNNKFYIGAHCTNNLNDGYLGSGKHLLRSIKKYGKENFTIEILSHFKSKEALFGAEKFIVKEDLIKDPLCMNMATGGKGGDTLSFHPRREEICKHFSKIRTGRSLSDKWKKNIGVSSSGEKNGMYGKCHTEASKEKMSTTIEEGGGRYGEKNGMYGKHHTETSKEKQSLTIKERGGYGGEKASMYGKHHSEETKKKLSESKKGKIGKPHTEETKKKMSIAQTGKKHTEETKEKLSGENHHFYGKHHTEESKKKMSVGVKGRIWIHNLKTSSSKFVKPNEYDTFLESGWNKGRLPNKQRTNNVK